MSNILEVADTQQQWNQVGRSFIEMFFVQPESEEDDDEDEWSSDEDDDLKSRDKEKLPELRGENEGLLEVTALHQVGYYDAQGRPYGHVPLRESAPQRSVPGEDDDLIRFEFQKEYSVDSKTDNEEEEHYAFTIKSRIKEANHRWGTGDGGNDETDGKRSTPKVQFSQTVELWTTGDGYWTESTETDRTSFERSSCELQINEYGLVMTGADCVLMGEAETESLNEIKLVSFNNTFVKIEADTSGVMEPILDVKEGVAELEALKSNPPLPKSQGILISTPGRREQPAKKPCLNGFKALEELQAELFRLELSKLPKPWSTTGSLSTKEKSHSQSDQMKMKTLVPHHTQGSQDEKQKSDPPSSNNTTTVNMEQVHKPEITSKLGVVAPNNNKCIILEPKPGIPSSEWVNNKVGENGDDLPGKTSSSKLESLPLPLHPMLCSVYSNSRVVTPCCTVLR